MRNRLILFGAFISILQVIIGGSTLFIFYRFLLSTIGTDQIGIWSIVMATASFISVVNLGGPSNVTKYVAKYLSLNNDERVSKIIQTSAITSAILLGISMVFFAPILKWILLKSIHLKHVEKALLILPYVLLSYWIQGIAAVFQSALDGCQRIGLRCILVMAGSIFQLLLSFILVPTYGLLGLAYTQIIYSTFLFITSFITLRKKINKLPIMFRYWDHEIFDEMLSSGLKYQIISIAQILYDPMTKILVGAFGGLSMAGFYEMSNRMVIQIRALLVNAYQVLVPFISALQEKDPQSIKAVYSNSLNLLIYFSFPTYSVLVALLPLISKVWIGHYEGNFVLISVLLTIGWFSTTLNAPAYFANMGLGDLRWNLLSQLIIGMVNGLLGIILGSLFGGIGVMIALVFALSLGGLLLLISFNNRHGIKIGDFWLKSNKYIGIAGIAVLICAHAVYKYFDWEAQVNKFGLIMLVISVLVLGIPLYFHPTREKIVRTMIGFIHGRVSYKGIASFSDE